MNKIQQFNEKEFLKISIFSPVYIARKNILNGIKTAAAKYSKGKLVDLGCGTKPYETIFKPYTDSYVGVDYENTAEKNYDNLTNADIFADCTDTKLESQSFDTLISTQVIEHVYDTKKFIEECYRLLKVDGIGIFTVPFLWQLHAEPYDFYRFTRYSLEQLFKNQGFNVLEIRPLEGAYAAIIQTRIVSLYRSKQNNVLIKVMQKILNLCWVPVLNFLAIKLDCFFHNDKLCLDYMVIVKKVS